MSWLDKFCALHPETPIDLSITNNAKTNFVAYNNW